jgi:cell wall-associated NlpC family hydrolase
VSARTTRARHRAARTPLIPFAEVSETLTANVGRHAAVVAAAGGILASALGGATSAQAQPMNHDHGKTAKTGLSELSQLTEQARSALRSTPVVTVSTEAKVSVEKMSVDITPAPERVREPELRSGSGSAAATADVAASDVGAAVAEIAKRYVGVPYVVGGASPSGFDCSGLVSYVYRQVGIELPHQSTGILDSPRTTVISAAEARPGDLLWSPGHIGIYIGGGLQVDASRPDGWNVDIREIWQSNPTYLRVS